MSSAATLAAVERALAGGGDPDDALRGVLEALHERFAYAAIAFVEEGELAPGPSVGAPPAAAASFPVSFREATVAELHVAPAPASPDEVALVERVAELISPHCLVGWDTGGEPWGESG